jgi:hypothetical protein
VHRVAAGEEVMWGCGWGVVPTGSKGDSATSSGGAWLGSRGLGLGGRGCVPPDGGTIVWGANVDLKTGEEGGGVRNNAKVGGGRQRLHTAR